MLRSDVYSMMSMYSALEWTGLAVVIFVSWLVIKTIWRYFYSLFIGHALGRSISPISYGPWAIITGATDGIGRAYAEELAARGLNVCLISRSLSKLQSVASDIETKYRVKTRVIDVDFTAGTHIYDRIGKEIEDLDYGILINNVGMSYNHPEFLTQIPNAVEFAQSLISCNVVSVTRMCLLVLNRMIERKKGLILNLSSASIIVGLPLCTMYSSTKAFVNKFSEDLALEYAPFGITVQCVLPGFVATNMSRIKRASFQAPTPRDYVRAQMKTWGIEMATSGYWFHKIVVFYYLTLKTLTPSYLRRSIWGKMLHHRDSGLRYMKKLRDREQGNISNGVDKKHQE